MAPHVSVTPAALRWAATQSGMDLPELQEKFPRWDDWITGRRQPTLTQLEALANSTGIPFGYLLLAEPPALELPIPDFREGLAGRVREPSTNLLAAVHQALRRQDWYRGYARDNSLPAVDIAFSGAELPPPQAADRLRQALNFEVDQRPTTWFDTRKHLLREFERQGGLTIVTSMVDNNTHRLLDEAEFRGFALVDEYAPLVFVNARQTLNGQIFTLAHEFAHIMQGASGVSLEDPSLDARSDIERWCNAVASEFLVPRVDLAERYRASAHLRLSDSLDRLSGVYKCGTLVVLIALRRHNLVEFDDFDAVYRAELERIRRNAPSTGESGGNFYANQPFRIGERLSRALIGDTLEGRTTFSEALRLMSLKSLGAFDRYASHLGIA